LTAGYGLSESQAYPALIEKKLAARGTKYRIINAGRSGDTTAGGLSRLGWYLKDRVNPRVLVIFLGSNDAIRGVPLETMEKNLRAIVEKARAFRKDLRIFLVELRTFPNLGADYGEEFREVFVRVAEDAKVELISFPLLEVAGRPELNQADGVHPNEDGTKKVAEVIWVAV
jgi:acyl-CoA thioesterase-1